MTLLGRKNQTGPRPQKHRLPKPGRLLFFLFASICWGGCVPSHPTLQDSEPGVSWTPTALPANDLMAGTFVSLGVSPPEGLPVIEVQLIPPEEVEIVSGWTSSYRQGLEAVGGFGGASFDSVRWLKGELPPRKGQVFTAQIRHPDPRPGEVLTFRVRLILSDSSTVEWTGPLGSERPAPTIAVEARWPRLGALAGLVGAALSILVLLFVGVYRVRVWRLRRNEGASLLSMERSQGLKAPAHNLRHPISSSHAMTATTVSPADGSYTTRAA
jgi:hypothetical protein